ncbi:hypothetical protein MASR2M18_20390 [Ignavibacteria bacterium]|nr:hypothetical protein [Bacteroidota bacterium]MCZ2131773.1 hypothetical protein [Bacteroidota bacterium]
MKTRILNILLVVTSLFGYLEWGADNCAFLFQTEIEVLYKLFTNPASIIHPFILLPLSGQLLLFITLFQKTPNKLLTYISIVGLGLLLGLMFIVGVISLNYKITLSTIPFFIVVALTIINNRKSNPA